MLKIFHISFLGIFFISFHSCKTRLSSQAESFLSITDSAYLIHTEGLPVPLDQDFTIEIKVNPITLEGNQILLSKQHCLGRNYAFYLSLVEGRVNWNWGTNGNCDYNSIFISKEAVPLRTWSHISVVHKADTVKMYLNGKEMSGELQKGEFMPVKLSTEPLRIAVYKDIHGYLKPHYIGDMDDIRIWKKVLSVKEIKKRMNSALSGNEKSLIFHNSMDRLIRENNISYIVNNQNKGKLEIIGDPSGDKIRIDRKEL